jgi:phosphatidylserine decarboxylase
MKIHKEGISVLVILFIILIGINFGVFYLVGSNTIYHWITVIVTVLLYSFVGFFFRNPRRKIIVDDEKIFAPADGEVVAVEQTNEDEYFKDQRIQVSIFMSIWDIHINWFPIGGIIKYFKYHPGKYYIARLPKSSTENERTTVVIEDDKKRQILVRQIAGIVARRIISYAHKNLKVKQNAELGFIRFGSRLDVFLPLDAKVKVKLGDKTQGSQTVIAEFNS